MKEVFINPDNLKKEDIDETVIRAKALVINDKKEIILGFYFGTYQFPGGHVDNNENIVECLKREVKEETGLDVNIEKYLGKFKYVADNGTRISTQFNFLCTLKDKNQKVKLSFEHDGYKWISTLAEGELLVPSEMKKIISKILPGLSIYKRKENEKIEE